MSAHPLRRGATAAAAGLGALVLTAALTSCGSAGGSEVENPKEITVYSADGLKSEAGDGFYDKVFADFEAKTGISVNYVEGGSGEIVQRLSREKANPQADVLVTLPPFIQQADGRELLAAYEPAGSQHVPADDKSGDGTWTAMVQNYACFIYNTEEVEQPPETWDDLLDPAYKGKLQYSTPGVAGDGTAMVIKAMHDLGGQKPAMKYFGKLQSSNVGPSSSTGALAPKVDKGELLIANGDVQMNYANQDTMPNQGIFFLAPKKGEKPTTFALPYAAGLVQGAPNTPGAKKFLDYVFSEKVQQQVTTVGGGFPAREDVEPTGENAEALRELMAGVEVFHPDWQDIDANLDSYIDAWQEATGS